MRTTFSSLLQELRTSRRQSLADLAGTIHFSRGYIGNVEHGTKFPTRQFAELADKALQGHGVLLGAWRLAEEEEREAERTRRLLAASVRESDALGLLCASQPDIAGVSDSVRALAVAYLGTPPAPILAQATQVRSGLVDRIKKGGVHAGDEKDLFLAVGQLSGVLSYAALDLGSPTAALAHARAAWMCADRVGDNELRAWTRGTQSLISRFQGDYERALQFIQSGQQYATLGTSGPRILCGLAQCMANLGNSNEANKALNAAESARAESRNTDSMPGLFEFSQAKQHYYAGSSLIWLDGREDAERAEREASLAIAMWEGEPPETRSLDDEALAHIYLGTARLQLGELDGGMSAIRPILDLPEERKISWIGKRLDRFSDMLTNPPFHGSSLARDAVEEIRALA
ncbi:helix-turn-helix domain-containing protein [Streptacidiphilus cavernicola]|uniref:Helix-turn-helix domain-containing protein n=1 Tax=Streptacidiphilus cavernicola TaxID=3342716 RepID=A0ABV6VS02_9ACTN